MDEMEAAMFGNFDHVQQKARPRHCIDMLETESAKLWVPRVETVLALE
jgi:hypothetical protein